MRNACRAVFGLLIAAVAILAQPAGAASLEELVSAVVRIKTYINPDGQTVQSLGREREGSGVIIDEDGLILTIGYLMVEAHAAEVTTNAGRTVPATVVGYDHETGFGILKTIEPLKIKPLPFGRSADVKANDPVLIASHGGTDIGGAGPCRGKARIRRQLGISARRGDLHDAAASGLERRRADLARGQAPRRRLADRRRRGRRRQRQRRATCSCRSSGCRRSSAT